MRGSLGMEHGAYLRIQEGEFHTPASTLSGKGMLGSQQAALTITLATSNFEEWRPLARFFARPTERIPLVLRSEATFSGTIRGPVLRPEIRGRVSMGPFDYHDWSWDSLAASILATPDLLEITSGRVLGGDSAVTAAGYVTLEDWRVLRDGPARLALSLRRTPLEGLKAALGVENDFGGVATGQLQLEGSLLRLAGAGDIYVAPGIFAGEPFDSLSARLRVSESVWHIEDLELTKGRGHLSGKASVDPSRRFVSIQLQGAGFALAEFKHLESFRAGGSESQLEGSASFDLQGEGTPEDGRLHATWAIRDIRVSRSAIVDLQGRVDWQGQQMQLEGEARGPGGALSFAGVARTEGVWNLELRGQYKGLRVDPWIRLARKEEFSAQVVATGVLNVRGPLKKPEELEVRSQAQSLEVSFPDLTWKNENPVSLRYANGALVADRFRMRGPSTDLEVEGSARFKEPTSLSIVARGEADATLLSLIDPALQASGRSELRVRVSGSPAEPLLNGVMSIRDVNLGYREFPFRVTGLNGEIALEGERATVRSLQGTSGGGRVVLSGFVTFAGTPRYDARAELLSVRASYPTDFTSVLDGNLRVMGTPDRAQINGELIVRQLFTSENLTLLSRMGEVGRLASEAPPGIATPLASRTRLNIQVRSAPAVRLETRDLRLVADMDLRVQGTLANPVEVGTIHLLSGEAVFRGNRYRIIRGDISMTNPLRTQRFLDLEAQTRVQQYDLTVNLSGPFDRLKVAYRSDPPLSAADTLSLLAFGYARQQEVMSTSATQPLPTVGASALLSEALSSQVSGRIQQLFGVSRIRIDPNVGGFSTATGGARVTVEQQVTGDLTLTYVTTTASSEQRIIQFEWVLSDRVSLIGARDRNGILGMELKFRQRFK